MSVAVRPEGEVLDRLLAIVGPKGLLTDPADTDPYLTECRERKRGTALCVVMPASTGEVAAVLRLAAEEGLAVFPLGGNTGLVCGALPMAGRSSERPGLLLSLRRMNKVRDIDAASGIAWVDAGVILASLHEAAAAVDRQFDLHLGSEGSAQIGGLISTNAGGTAALRHGPMRDLVAGLEVVLADGRVLSDMSALRKNNTGYMLRQLFIGAEGTLGIITGAALKLNPRMTHHAHAWVGLATAEAVVELYALFRGMAGSYIEAFELLSASQVELVERHVHGARIALSAIPPWSVMIELSAIDEATDLDGILQRVLELASEREIIDDAVIAMSTQQAEEIWRVRHSLAEANSAAGVGYPLDIAVRTSVIPRFIAEAGEVCAARFPQASILIIGHLGDGNLHYVLLFPHDYWHGLDDRPALIRAVEETVHDVAVRLGGTFSAEHGIGRKLTAELSRLGEPIAHEYMRKVKAVFDPENRMNPGALF